MKVPSEIFREYDIRGLVGEQLTRELSQALGRAAGTLVRAEGGSRLVVGRDHRLSGESLAGALIEGLRSAGIHVIDIGVCPTPVGYWATHHFDVDGQIQVTGSHNPSEYNGYKMSWLGESVYGEKVQLLRQCIESEDFATGEGGLETRGVIEPYLDDLAQRLGPAPRRLKVVVDAGNGTGGITGVPLYERLGYQVIPLYCELDGTFPNHHPDPTVEENLEDLRSAVAQHGAHLGIAFDGDADRLGIIDKQGEVIWGDKLLIVLAREVLQHQPGAPILGEVKCSKTLYDDIRKHGGQPVMWRTGHSLIKAKMKEMNAPLAGEMSGHIFYKHRYYGFDDGVYAGARLLHILAHSGQTLTQLLSDVPPTVSTPELRLPCSDAEKFALVERVRQSFERAAPQEGFEVIGIDGVRVQWSDGWGLVRPSNTQPILVLRYEAESQERLNQIRARFEAEVRGAGGEV